MHRLTLVGVLLLVTGLIARGIPADPIWYDEHRSYYYAGWDDPGTLPFADTITRTRGSDVQAPGYFLLLNAWGRLAGQTPFSGRVLSLFAAVLAVAVIYRAGCDLGSWRAGLAAALTMGTSAFFVVYGHETRTYALLCLSIALALLAYWRLRHGGGVVAGALFVVSMAALPYMHYLSALLFPALGLYHLLTFERTRRWWAVTGLAVIAALLFTPWAAVALEAAQNRATVTRSTVPTMDFMQVLAAVGGEFSNGSGALLGVLLGVAAWGVVRGGGQGDALSLRGGAGWRRTGQAPSLRGGAGWRRAGDVFVWLTGAAMLVLVVAFDQVIPVLNHSRYLIVLWAFVALLVGFGAARLAQLGVPLALVLTVWGAFGVVRSTDAAYRLNVNGPGAYAAWDFAGAFLRERVAEDDMVALHLPFGTLYEPYHEPIADYYLHGLDIDTTAIESLRLQPDADYVRAGLARVGDAGRLWYLRELDNVPERFGVFDRALDDTLAHCGAILNDDAYQLDLYIAPPDAADATATFGDGIQFVPAFSTDDDHGAYLYVTSGWVVADDVPPHTYSVALHLLDADGNLAAGADYGLPEAGTNCGYGAFDLSALPPGDYRLTVGVYAWETGEMLPVSGTGAERVTLGWIE